MGMICAGMATTPERLTSLALSVSSLLSQVDRLHVALNGHGEVPSFLHHPKITTTLCDNSLGDGAKFMGLDGEWLLTCDDDLIYPVDYVETMIAGAKRYGCIVTLHGRSFAKKPIRSYYRNKARKYSCLKEVMKDVMVEVGGTGCMCWNREVFRFGPADIESVNMADLWLSVKAAREGVPIMVLAHEGGWLKHVLHVDTIHGKYRMKDGEQTRLYNEVFT
jgi:hypothetical protein